MLSVVSMITKGMVSESDPDFCDHSLEHVFVSCTSRIVPVFVFAVLNLL